MFPAWAYRGFPCHNSQPSYDQWRMALQTEIAGSVPLQSATGEAGGTGPMDAARQPFAQTPAPEPCNSGRSRAAATPVHRKEQFASGCPAYAGRRMDGKRENNSTPPPAVGVGAVGSPEKAHGSVHSAPCGGNASPFHAQAYAQ